MIQWLKENEQKDKNKD